MSPIERTIVHIYEPDSTPEDEVHEGIDGVKTLVLPAAERNGFKLFLVSSNQVVLGTGARPHLYVGDDDLLAQRKCFTVSRSSSHPAAARYLTAIYETIIASDSVLLNDSISNSESLERDKLAIACHGAQIGVPTVPTIHVPFGEYAQRVLIQAKELNSAGFILKPREMGSGQGVLKVDSLQQLRAAIDIVAQTGNAYVIQPLVKNQGDLRVFVMGEEVIASLIRRPKAGDYLANLSKGGAMERVEISSEVKELSLRVAKSLNARYIVVDWLVTPKGPVLNEWTTALAGFGFSDDIADHFFNWAGREIERAERRGAAFEFCE